uniref:type I secretion system permease/ATPase n=1 Tax=uncultured Rhizobium sp. TaxID=155567 RepID=UPI0026283ECC|nr:type I secretion system permease/ATPase [uncultured Rhizobium sp.]
MTNEFTASFRALAGFMNRPTADILLFSGVPFDPQAPTYEEVERLASRIGLDAHQVTVDELRRRAFELPLMLLFADRTSMVLLEEDAHGLSMLSGDGTRVTFAEVLQKPVVSAFSFAAVYQNDSEAGVTGTAEEIDRVHWLRAILKPFWRSYLDVALATFLINVLALTAPLFTMNVYDRVLPNKAVATLWVLAIGVSGAILFDFILKSIRAATIDFAGRKADLKLSYKLFDKILNTSLKSRPMSTGEYANRVSQYEFVREFFTSNTISVAIDCVFVFMFVAVIYIIIGWIAVVPLAAFFIVAAIGYYAQIKIGRVMGAALNEASQRQSLLIESISALETIKLLNAEATLLRRWHTLAKNASHTSEEIKHISAWAANITQFIQQLVTVVIILAGAYEFAAGNITSGAIVATTMLAGRAVAPLGQLALTLARMRQAFLSLRILDEIMAQDEDRPSTTGFVNRTINSGALTFHNVGFSYPGTDHQVINNISFTIQPGEKVGIIGRVGSGKTTMGRLISGLYTTGGGRVLIDGVDIRQYHPAVVRSAIAFVSQNSDLFSGTVKDNLLMAAPTATDEQIIEAAKIAGVDSFVSRHPRGYDMPVGERGNLLSGGQRAAIAIARIMLRKPSIVFLDEPSGSMDMASEKELIDKLLKCFPTDVTLLVSTHRYSMLALVDRLIVLEQGRLISDGPKNQVIEGLKAGSVPARARG